MFEFREQRYPKNWKEMSWDMRMMFIYHGCMLVLFATGGLGYFSARSEVTIAGLLLVVLAFISIHHRQVRRWRWPGATSRTVFGTLGGLALGGVFLYSATPMFHPSDPGALPWYLGGAGIVAFGALQSLGAVQASELEFQANCRQVDQFGRELEATVSPAQPERTIAEPTWKRSLRGAYTVAFLVAWLSFVAFFYYSGRAFEYGSPQPTATQTEPLQSGGKTVYVTRDEKQRVDSLEEISSFGIPTVLLSGFLLHFIVGVKLFPNAPTLRDYLLNRRKAKESSA